MTTTPRSTLFPYTTLFRSLAYTSISSMIRTLELKGYVSHRKGEGKTHVYFPVIDAEKAGESALGRVLNKIYGGSPIKLLAQDRKSTRLNSSHITISYAVFC